MDEMTKVLYVDDEPINLSLFTAVFRNRFRVVTALSGEKGLAEMKSHPDIRAVITDMRMPEMNGIEFVKLAREDFPDVSYYILTGYDISAEISDAIKNGLIREFFRKPFNVEEIEGSIKDSRQ